MPDKNILESIFENVPFTQTERDKVLNSFSLIKISKNDLLLKEGQVPQNYYYVNNGFLRSYVIDDKGNDISTGFYSKEDLLQDMPSLFLKVPTQENIQAITDASVWKISHHDSEILFHSIETYRKAGRTRLVKGYYELKKRNIEMISKSAQERYISLLKDHPEILRYAPLKHIATYLGITDTSLSRIRKDIAHT